MSSVNVDLKVPLSNVAVYYFIECYGKMPMADSLPCESLTVAILSLLYFSSGEVDLWTTIFIIDDLLNILNGPQVHDPSKAVEKLIFKRLL